MSSSPAKTAVEALPELVNILKELPGDERKKLLAAAAVVLGESLPTQATPSNPGTLEGQVNGLSAKAAAWLRKTGLSVEQLENVFSIDANEVEVIAAKLPGKSKKEQTVSAYVLCGLAEFLKTGEMAFDDEKARELCQKVGCYDRPNHGRYIKSLGNFVGGSKGGGWKLTNPGLNEAAKIVKELSTESA